MNNHLNLHVPIAQQREIKLLRAALNARQRATPDTAPTPAEIHLRAYQQIRACECLGETHPDQRSAWLDIAMCFHLAARTLCGNYKEPVR